ncbi:MAG: hypothetical protein ABEK12_03535 [Candidatus Nanohaloarchaea archaeon]
MSYLQLGAAFVGGAVVGAGGLLLYIRYRTMKQMQQMQDQMDGLLDEEMMQGLDEPADGE